MEKKSYEHNEKETCKICKREIKTSFDDWCSLIDYRMQTQRAIGFFHASCLNDLIKGQGKVIQKRFQDKLFGTIGRIFGGKTQEEVGETEEEFIKV